MNESVCQYHRVRWLSVSYLSEGRDGRRDVRGAKGPTRGTGSWGCTSRAQRDRVVERGMVTTSALVLFVVPWGTMDAAQGWVMAGAGKRSAGGVCSRGLEVGARRGEGEWGRLRVSYAAFVTHVRARRPHVSANIATFAPCGLATGTNANRTDDDIVPKTGSWSGAYCRQLGVLAVFPDAEIGGSPFW